MSSQEDFTLVSTNSRRKIFDDYEEVGSGKVADLDTALQKAFRQQYPELVLTVTIAGNVSLLQFAAAGHATAELDIKDEAVKRFRYFYAGNDRQGIPDQLVDGRSFAKYIYRWGGEYFIVYVVVIGFNVLQYILKEPGEGETTTSRSATTDKLIETIGKWQKPDDKYIYVYDRYWMASRPLYDEVQKANWADVILNEGMKKTLTDLMHKFFDSEDVYKDLGVPWKRGVIFHGPAGNGKTISIKALMHSLFKTDGFSIPSLYVKSASQTYDIRNVFMQARAMAPCLLVLEDIDTIVTAETRSYFFNEVDGLENNDGLFLVASTNHLDRLDPGLSSRPSRFDRKYLFPLPSEDERALYCEYWRKKLHSKPSIDFPKRLSPAIAKITDGFSFAYLKEAFVATLLIIAGNRSDEETHGGGDDDDDDDLDKYELWREIKKQIKSLREEMGSHEPLLHPEGQKAAKHPAATPSVSQEPSDDNDFAPCKQLLSPLALRQRTAAPIDVDKSRNNYVDSDFYRAPLMTDSGWFLDGRFNGNGKSE